jgi:phosphatidate cytidylyltransferase
VDSGEESEEEQVAQPTTPQESVPLKPTKSALKKAAKIARTEKRQQQKAAKTQMSDHSQEESSSSGSPRRPPATLEPVKVVHESYEITPVADTSDDTPKGAPDEVPPQAALQHPVAQADYNFHHDDMISSADQSYPTSMEPSGRNSPEPLVRSADEKILQAGVVDGDVQLVLKTKQEAERTKTKQNAVTRTIWGFAMIGGFIGLLLMGHVYMIMLVLLCQTLVYREVTTLFSLRNTTPESGELPRSKKDPWSKTLNWYFFAVTNYFLYGESIIYYFKHVVFTDAQLLPFATNHRIISFTLYTIGFVGFVMSLKKGYLKQQFGLFCWVHMSLLLIVVSSHFIVNNILEGLIWFWVPASLVICNDVFAYVWGVTLGRTPLIKLSPKKTLEGFVGAFFSTVIFGVFWGTYFMRYAYMTCPVHDLGVSAWSSMKCEPNPVFMWKVWQTPAPLNMLLNTLGWASPTIAYAPYQFHLLFMSCFASLVAPFGGFFASGFKRAFNIKDFGHSIPGHGGMTDRMDCQFLMGVFTYVYYSSLIREHHVTSGSILQMIVSGLTVEQQLELLSDLKKYLSGQGIKI